MGITSGAPETVLTEPVDRESGVNLVHAASFENQQGRELAIADTIKALAAAEIGEADAKVKAQKLVAKDTEDRHDIATNDRLSR